jgi:transposase
MIRPGFLSSADRIELEACVRRQREDHGIARRANAILLLDDGESCARIAKFLYLDDDTIRGWYKSYRQDGWDALAFDGWKGGQSRMTQEQEAGLCAWLEERFCRSTVEIRAHICAEFGLDYSNSGCIKLLARLGFEYRKPKPLPRVASAQMQAAFIAAFERLMRELPADEAVYFAPSRACKHTLPGNGCGASGIPDQARIWLGEGWIKSGSSQHGGAWSCEHSWGCEPRNLRCTLCRTVER